MYKSMKKLIKLILILKGGTNMRNFLAGVGLASIVGGSMYAACNYMMTTKKGKEMKNQMKMDVNNLMNKFQKLD